jgi:hypothetical protein
LRQAVEVRVVGGRCCRGRSARDQKTAQLLTILISANELAHIFAARPVATLIDLLVDELLQSVRQRDVHRGHSLECLQLLAKIDKPSGQCAFCAIGLSWSATRRNARLATGSRSCSAIATDRSAYHDAVAADPRNPVFLSDWRGDRRCAARREC